MVILLEKNKIYPFVVGISQQAPSSPVKYKGSIRLGSLPSSGPDAQSMTGLDTKTFSGEDSGQPGNLMLWAVFSYQCGVVRKHSLGVRQPLLVCYLVRGPQPFWFTSLWACVLICKIQIITPPLRIIVRIKGDDNTNGAK